MDGPKHTAASPVRQCAACSAYADSSHRHNAAGYDCPTITALCQLKKQKIPKIPKGIFFFWFGVVLSAAVKRAGVVKPGESALERGH